MNHLELLKNNKAILQHFKVGENVVLHPQPARLDNKMYGTIKGYALNAERELMLVVEVAVMEDPKFDSIQRVEMFDNDEMVVELV